MKYVLLFLFILSFSALAQNVTIPTERCSTCSIINVPATGGGGTSGMTHGISLQLTPEPCEARTFDSQYDQAANTITITKRSDCNPQPKGVSWTVYCSPNPCDFTIRRVWREVYGVKDGKLALLQTIEGKIAPAQSETVVWPQK